MKKAFGFVFIFVCLICLAVPSCKKEQNFPITPVISFKQFSKFSHASVQDSATCTINFTDGDGDIGLDQFDTVAPYNPKSRYYYDMYLVYYWLDQTSNTWKVYNKNLSDTVHIDTLQYTYRIPNLSQNGQKKSLEGEIKVHLNAPWAVPLPTHKKVKFKITLIDRALHVSNQVETNVIDNP
jgi:hypothetical protein